MSPKALALVCTGFFMVHSAAAGALNRKVQVGRGQANAFYVLCYYIGGAAGITLSGQAYQRAGWHGVVALAGLALLVPLGTSRAMELRVGRRA